LVGERVYLRALDESDVDGDYVAWLNDPEVCQFNAHHVFPYDRAAALSYIAAAKNAKNAVIVAVCLKDGDKHIGNLSLQSISPVYRSAEYAVLMGDRASWGKGYAKEASLLIMRHGFRELNLHRVHCGTSEENVPMQRLARFMGMKEEGRRRQAMFKHGRFLDVIEYGVLRDEFFEAHPA
jgi:RimJ/RimL family protein N-acetyltransferase